jgi:hypothetical protein
MVMEAIGGGWGGEACEVWTVLQSLSVILRRETPEPSFGAAPPRRRTQHPRMLPPWPPAE